VLFQTLFCSAISVCHTHMCLFITVTRRSLALLYLVRFFASNGSQLSCDLAWYIDFPV